MKRLLIGSYLLALTLSFSSQGASCIEDASKQGLSKKLSESLCSRSFNAPVECYKKMASKNYLSDDGHAIWLDNDQALELCRGAIITEGPINCILEAYAKGKIYSSKYQAIVLCSGANSNAPISCFNKRIYQGRGGFTIDIAKSCQDKD